MPKSYHISKISSDHCKYIISSNLQGQFLCLCLNNFRHVQLCRNYFNKRYWKKVEYEAYMTKRTRCKKWQFLEDLTCQHGAATSTRLCLPVWQYHHRTFDIMHISSPINKIIANVNKGLIWELYDDNIYLNKFNALIMTQFVWSLVRGWSCTSSGNSHNSGIIKIRSFVLLKRRLGQWPWRRLICGVIKIPMSARLVFRFETVKKSKRSKRVQNALLWCITITKIQVTFIMLERHILTLRPMMIQPMIYHCVVFGQ